MLALIVMLMCVQDEISERLLRAAQHPNLVTVAALPNSHPETARINAIAAYLFQLSTLIRTTGIWQVQKAEKTVLYSGIEKGWVGGRGRFSRPNALGAAAFEVLVSKDGARGKVLWYADTLFAQARAIFEWIIRERASLYTLREWQADTLTVEQLELYRSGEGEYERRRNHRLTRKLHWTHNGKLQCDEMP
ncbi:MAG: hypothetical protein RMI34_04785 [Chloroherpetonaceae bacterium]|nr:hypothetical protein [Chloroherpetonaceae bacterium]MCS7210351.1 hypothetical protein [Chloroherpetonaceae bacterium]MDW8019374.1 hypothetical protein [Chloroherpetonaceae bacterium]MDW8467001.1 hypothetical protein [Chloroherpetonaceae bacterium]